MITPTEQGLAVKYYIRLIGKLANDWAVLACFFFEVNNYIDKVGSESQNIFKF